MGMTLHKISFSYLLFRLKDMRHLNLTLYRLSTAGHIFTIAIINDDGDVILLAYHLKVEDVIAPPIHLFFF